MKLKAHITGEMQVPRTNVMGSFQALVLQYHLHPQMTRMTQLQVLKPCSVNHCLTILQLENSNEKGSIALQRCRFSHFQNCRPQFLVSWSSMATRSFRFFLRQACYFTVCLQHACLTFDLLPRFGKKRPGIRLRSTRRN